MSPTEADTVELGVPTVPHAAAGLSLTTGRRTPMATAPRPGETPDHPEQHPLWPRALGIVFAFLVGWVIPPPGPSSVDGAPTGAVRELPAGR
ncbi:hypothetical protein [Actinomycetospora sp. NBRC 106378]|uniref:hypothetical protein n=1 Tax=Actinomycetospora sp. NBRC 106378 TaxID=3032208 RepID=UPI0024A14C87|nr:hypothetical protein [Actinomycetospora sp. NBRC 106378]GLZ53441.1 hypothetical protein Acsp07_30580 [Actinomycetospora sp. NBRC 106378]